MTQFFQQLINGLSIGSVYALMAVGYSLVYSIMNFSNFAHGGVIMFGAYFGYFFLTFMKFPFPLAFLSAAVCAAILALIIERVAYKPLRERRAPFLYFIMGASIFMENLVIAIPAIGPTFRTYPAIFNKQPIQIGELAMGKLDIMMFLISAICLIVLIYIIDHTKIGKAIQATSYNIKASALMGVNTDFVLITIFLMGGFLAGIAGVLFGMKYTVYPQIGIITNKSAGWEVCRGL